MTQDINQHAIVAAVLAWHEAMGVDAAVSNDAIDWLARGETVPGAGFAVTRDQSEAATQPAPSRTPHIAEPAAPSRAQRPSLLPPSQNVRATPTPLSPSSRLLNPSMAGTVKARSLLELETELGTFEGCGLKATATKLCLYRGAETARLMIIGEAPGRDEDLEGKPFVGPAGQLLDKMLASIGATSEHVHFTNVVYWRPPGNRTPAPAELAACAPFVSRQIELVAPDVILLLGAVAAKQFLDTAEAISRLRGNWFETNLNGRVIKTMPTWHPAFILQTPAAKRQVWRDLLAVKYALR